MYTKYSYKKSWITKSGYSTQENIVSYIIASYVAEAFCHLIYWCIKDMEENSDWYLHT